MRWAQQGKAVLGGGGRVERAGGWFQAVGVDLGEVQGVVDDRQQVAAGDFQRLRVLALVGQQA